MPKKGYKWPKEYRLNRSKRYDGVGNPFYGKKHSEETKNKMSQTRIGKKYPKLSEALKGKLPWNTGLKHKKETIEKIKQARLRQVFPRKDSQIEVRVQNWLKEQKIEFETHLPIIGQPDIFIEPNLLIFCDGCYWHKCPECGFGNRREKDLRIIKELNKSGYKIIRLWEHEINNGIWKEKFAKNVMVGVSI